MTYLLTLFYFFQDGTQREYSMAIFTDPADCAMVGALSSAYLERTNKIGTLVRYDCQPM